MIDCAKMDSRLYLLANGTSPLNRQITNTVYVNSVSVGSSNDNHSIILWHYLLDNPNFLYLKQLFSTLFKNENSLSF